MHNKFMRRRGLPIRRKPQNFGHKVYSSLILTHVSIIFSDILIKSYLLNRRLTECSATLLSAKAVVSDKSFSPQYLRCLMSRPVSCYAFFKEWLLPSLSSDCQKAKTTFVT
jgi:hypothetical protein